MPVEHDLSLFSLALGVRTEQDLYVRLIDSVTKQVSRADLCHAVLSHLILPVCSTFPCMFFLLWFTLTSCSAVLPVFEGN